MKKFRTFLILSLVMLSSYACADEMRDEEKAIIDRDGRNENVDFNLTSKDTSLAFCINNLADEGSPLDVLRILLHTAELLNAQSYHEVELCFREEPRFLISGAYFKKLGEEFEDQNPMYTMRTFPENVKLLDGQQAYGSRQGGLLYQMQAQMDDFQNMNNRWFLEDLLAEKKLELDKRRPKEFANEDEIF